MHTSSARTDASPRTGRMSRARAARRRRRGDRRPWALGDPGPRRLPYARVLRGRSRRGVLAARGRRLVRGIARARRGHPLDGARDARGRRGRPRRGARRARGLDAARRDDDLRGEVGVRARSRHRARPASRGPRCRRCPHLARSARRTSRVRRRRRRRVPRLPPAEVLPEAAKIAEAADVFLERGAFDADQARRYLTRVPRGRPRPSPARRPVHRVGCDPARDRARSAIRGSPRGDRAGRRLGARSEATSSASCFRRARSS